MVPAVRLGDALADVVTLKQDFEHTGVLDELGGVAYLAQLLGSRLQPAAALVGGAKPRPELELTRAAFALRDTPLDDLTQAYAAETPGTETLRKAARQLAHAADVLPGTVSQLERAAGQVMQLR